VLAFAGTRSIRKEGRVGGGEEGKRRRRRKKKRTPSTLF
jgi:hypothetical protein